MFALASWLTNTQAGEGFGPGSLVEPAQQKLNGRVSYLTHEAFLHLAPQHSLSLTPATAWRKRQASRYHSVNRSGHVLSFAGDGLPLGVLWQRRLEKALIIKRQNRAVPW
jgi:hypothetical protein